MGTSRRIRVCVVGAVCATAPPAEGFTPPGCMGECSRDSLIAIDGLPCLLANAVPVVGAAAWAFVMNNVATQIVLMLTLLF